MDEALRFSQSHGVRAGCQALDLPPSSLYREKLRRERPALDPRPRAASPRALSPPEREAVVEVLHSRQFIDKAPAAVWAELLDEGRYLCSIRTNRILAERLEVRERRRQRRLQAGTSGHRPEPMLVVGHHQDGAITTSRDPGHLQPLCGGLDGGHPGKLPPGQGLDRPELLQAGDRSGWSHPACRSWLVDEFQSTGLVTGRSVTKSHSRPHVRNPNSRPSSTVPNSRLVSARFSKPETVGVSSIGITATIAIRVSACTLPRTCTTSPP